MRIIRFALVSSLLALQTGCQDRSRVQELHLSTVEDSPNLSQLKAQVPFRAEVLEVHILEETNLLSATAANGTSNYYQFVLRDQSGRERVFAGVNASKSDLEALKSLQKTNNYTFPDVLKTHGKSQ